MSTLWFEPSGQRLSKGMCLCTPRSWFVCEPELVISEAFDAYADPYKRVVSKVFKSFLLRVSEVLKSFTFLEQCFRCPVASSPCHSLVTSLISSLLSVLAHGLTWQSCDANARFTLLPHFFLNLSESSILLALLGFSLFPILVGNRHFFEVNLHFCGGG